MTNDDVLRALAASTNWRTATASKENGSGCVEFGTAMGMVGIRDSKLGAASPILAFTPHQWSRFLDTLKDQRPPQQTDA
ncbi:hypothetical protein GCM10022247_35260 [Allokutzneria multivorans]|uniref:DUF397 domain-containing protein n=1 Tax=Allokutzneria multivorans TaxID=1142134 RepID=A0ABP7SD30_9PSEU